MNLSDLAPGSIVFIEVKKKDSDFTFPASIQKSDANGVSVVLTVNDSDFELEDTDELYVRLSQKGISVRWYVESWKYVKVRDTLVILLSKLGQMENLNQRGAFRLPFGKPLTIEWNYVVDSVFTKDISFLGIGFESDKEMYKGDLVKVYFNHNGTNHFLLAEIVRKVALKKDDFEYGASFLGEENEDWMDYVLKQQQEMLRRHNSPDKKPKTRF